MALLSQVMELSENLKLHIDSRSGKTQPDASPRTLESESAAATNPGDLAPIDDAESQMRKALGLLGEPSRHRADADRADQPARMGDRFNGGLHRRRFVQDGDIPVTVLRREQSHDVAPHRGVATPSAPTSSRLQRTEAALAAETAAREKAERALAETQSALRDLQTKIGHAELARTEATEALRREREAAIQLRIEIATFQEQFAEALEQARAAERIAQVCQEQLADEQSARKVAEKALRVAETARDTAEQLVQSLSEEVPAPYQPPLRRARIVVEPEPVVMAPRRTRPAEVAAATTEPEPVKWWLNTKTSSKKRS